MSIKEIRSSLNMTQKEFSEYFSIPLKTYQRWEQGITDVPKPMMYMMVRILVLEGKLDETICKKL